MCNVGSLTRSIRQQVGADVGRPSVSTFPYQPVRGCRMAVSVTYREIAERFGIGIEGARIKAKRRAAKGQWLIIPGNHPQDIVRVEVPEEEWNSPQPSPTHTPNDGILTPLP